MYVSSNDDRLTTKNGWKLRLQSDYLEETIEENNCAKLLVGEIKETQLPPKDDDDMDLVLDVDVSEDTIRNYECECEYELRGEWAPWLNIIIIIILLL